MDAILTIKEIEAILKVQSDHDDSDDWYYSCNCCSHKFEKSMPRKAGFELDELCSQLQNASDDGIEIVLKVWKRGSLRGKIFKLDALTNLVHFGKGSLILKIPFLDILKIESTSVDE
jgi:hypothetical protein